MEYTVHGSNNQIDSSFFNYFWSGFFETNATSLSLQNMTSWILNTMHPNQKHWSKQNRYQHICPCLLALLALSTSPKSNEAVLPPGYANFHISPSLSQLLASMKYNLKTHLMCTVTTWNRERQKHIRNNVFKSPPDTLLNITHFIIKIGLALTQVNTSKEWHDAQ